VAALGAETLVYVSTPRVPSGRPQKQYPDLAAGAIRSVSNRPLAAHLFDSQVGSWRPHADFRRRHCHVGPLVMLHWARLLSSAHQALYLMAHRIGDNGWSAGWRQHRGHDGV